MPEKLIRDETRFYRKKGYSLKRSKSIAWATANKLGLLGDRKRKGRKRGKNRR